MFLYRKNIILVPSDYDGVSSVKGLVSFDCYDGVAECTLKTYNYASSKPLVFGVAINGKLTKFEVKPNSVKSFDFKLPFTIKNNDDISCVLIDIEDGTYTIILWGSTQINTAWKSTLKMMIEDENNFYSQQTVSQSHSTYNQQSPKTNNIDEKGFGLTGQNNDGGMNFFDKINYDMEKDCKEVQQKGEIQSSISSEDDELDKYIEKVIELTENEEKTVYDTQLNQDSKSFSTQNDQVDNNFKSQDQNNSFYSRISAQINKMFEVNQPEKVLNEIIPSSKFCRVEFDDGNGYYVFGIIYDEGMPKYLCYGVPAKKGDKPPKEINSLYQWLPVDVNDMSGDGFYIMYQDAESGKNISVDII